MSAVQRKCISTIVSSKISSGRSLGGSSGSLKSYEVDDPQLEKVCVLSCRHIPCFMCLRERMIGKQSHRSLHDEANTMALFLVFRRRFALQLRLAVSGW